MELSAAEAFTREANSKISDKKHRNHLINALSKFDSNRGNAASQYDDHELAKQRAAHLKWKSLENLDSYLIEFEANFIKSGGKVIWAQDAEGAVKEILALLKRQKTKSVLKSKSVTIEEIALLPALSKHGIISVNTDIGEFIQQLFNESTYHPALPAIHKSKEDISALFHSKFDLPNGSTIDQIVAFVRQHLRAAYSEAEVGITGANYLIADIGAVSLSENQGNSNLLMGGPRTHIVIAGIEKIIPSILDVDLFWPLHATHSTGNKSWVYNSICSGPKEAPEHDGPEEMYVILLDNGRSNLLEKEEQRKALSCIRCGACLNVCPVFQNVGGHTYGGGIGGPIGAVTMPFLNGLKEYKHLSYASTLCGKCTDVCPVKIDLHKMFSLNRSQLVNENYISASEKGIYLFWKMGMLNREKMNKGGSTFKNFLLAKFFKKQWGKQRQFPKIAQKSFNESWRENHP